MKLIGIALSLLLLQCTVIGKRHKMKTKLRNAWRDFQNDVVLTVEPIPPEFETGECSCTCCDAPPAPLKQPKCPNDIVIAIDSSACFRDHHTKMIRFLKKLVRRIGRTPNIQYGGDESRLSLMQFSSDIVFPLELKSFENYTNPSSNKALTDAIIEHVVSLSFLGEGAFLNKALNSTVDQIKNNPRPADILKKIQPLSPRPVVIVLTNGKSHPSVTMDHIEYSISDLRSIGATVIPVAVTRQCHGIPTDVWNEGLCPDAVNLKKLAEVGRSDGGSFLEMNSHDTVRDIVGILQACLPTPAPITSGEVCNNCTCTCELPVGPIGPPGLKGERGDFVQGEQGVKGDVGPKGSIGDQGDVGPNGDIGQQGERGETGPKGDTGKDGGKGDQGIDGTKGDVGPKGEEGKPGVDGENGAEGEKGTKGDLGEKGITGIKGEQGSKGRNGHKGDIGEVGPKGDKGEGIKGDIGIPGLPGPQGDKGDDGMPGDQGDKGNNGLCGKPGPAGKPGMEGIAGTEGADGLPGPPGRQGTGGEPGVPGDKGDRGEIGAPGRSGDNGLTGERGPVGPEGGRGHKGEKGEPSTVPGSPGTLGAAGPKGNSGRDGADGLAGLEGPSGRQGPRGERGDKGMPGVINHEELRPIIVEIIRKMLPGDCGTTAQPPTTTTEAPSRGDSKK